MSTAGSGINDAGQIVGSWNGYPYNAFFRDQGGNYTSASNAAFSAITDNGLITGYTLAGFQDFIIDATGHYTYFTTPYRRDPLLADFAWGINQSGVVVGSYTGITDSGFGVAAFIRDASGRFTRFSVRGADATIATGIDDNGDIVGYYTYTYPTTSVYHGFIRSPAGTIQSIDYPGASSTILHGINNSGQIVGAVTINGTSEGLLISPLTVPEPSGWVEIATGLIALAIISRRRIKSPL